MDAREQELKRHALQGDVDAALRLEVVRIRGGLVRVGNTRFPRYDVELNDRHIKGPITIVPRGGRRFEIRASEEDPLYVHNIPHQIRYTFYYFTEEDELPVTGYLDEEEYITGWLHSTPDEIKLSQESQRGASWSLHGFIAGHYKPEETLFKWPETIFRVAPGAYGIPQHILPTIKARQRLTNFLTVFIEEWTEAHPQEVDLAHAMFLNNRIIERKLEYDRLLMELEEEQGRLGSLIIEELGF